LVQQGPRLTGLSDRHSQIADRAVNALKVESQLFKLPISRGESQLIENPIHDRQHHGRPKDVTREFPENGLIDMINRESQRIATHDVPMLLPHGFRFRLTSLGHAAGLSLPNGFAVLTA
jgi:hypothetical protein